VLLSLVFSYREALYEDVQGMGSETQQEDGCEGEFISTLDRLWILYPANLIINSLWDNFILSVPAEVDFTVELPDAHEYDAIM
ncbi:hypothetical protein C0995_005344, partial [Termitomyces sp. Mi166